MSAAWRYTASIPTYITGKDVDGEPVVLYRVNVLLQSMDPDASASPPTKTPFFVLRRYSQFRQLFDQVGRLFLWRRWAPEGRRHRVSLLMLGCCAAGMTVPTRILHALPLQPYPPCFCYHDIWRWCPTRAARASGAEAYDDDGCFS